MTAISIRYRDYYGSQDATCRNLLTGVVVECPSGKPLYNGLLAGVDSQGPGGSSVNASSGAVAGEG